MLARYTITIDGVDYLVEPGTFVEGAVRRQAEILEFQEGTLKSRPDVREFWQTSWTGGSQWEKPRYNPTNRNTYFDAANINFTDRAGALTPSRQFYFDTHGLNKPSTPIIAHANNGVEGAIAIDDSGANNAFYKWNGSTFVSGSTTFGDYTYMAGTSGSGDRVYAISSTGVLIWWDSGGGSSTVSTGLSMYPGANIWADDSWVWVYNGDKIYQLDIDDSYNVEDAAGTINDGDGPDVMANMASGTQAVIPSFSMRRAISTAEGFFYVKNVFENGVVTPKVYRVDRDASGAYINAPIGTLPKGTVAVNMTMHLGSIIISTVANYWALMENTDHQRVTFYHITGGSIGAIGSPLGSFEPDETPVWFLGTHDEMLYIGGLRRIWQYDARVGALHPLHKEEAAAYLNGGGGWCQSASVSTTSGSGILFFHCGNNATDLLIQEDDVIANDNAETNYIESNWFDFDLPMEVKTVDEYFVDFDNIRGSATVTVKLLADNGSFQTLGTVSSSDIVGRFTPSATLSGHRFRYRLEFSDDSASSGDPTALLSIGFSATAGEMVDVLQFTINGEESVNIENNVQIPADVYANMSTLRATASSVSVTHSMKSSDADDTVTGTYKVVSVTTNKDTPREGMYDVVLMSTTAGRIAEDLT